MLASQASALRLYSESGKKRGKDSLDRNAGGLTLNSSVLILFFCCCLFWVWAVAELRELNITANEALRRILSIKII